MIVFMDQISRSVKLNSQNLPKSSILSDGIGYETINRVRDLLKRDCDSDSKTIDLRLKSEKGQRLRREKKVNRG